MRLVHFGLLAVVAAAPAALPSVSRAQAASAGPASGENPAAVQGVMLEHQRQLLLAMVDSMPERLYRDKATPGQRDFAQQVVHAATAAVFIPGRALKGPKPSLPDTATAFTRAGLRAYVNAAYDYSTALLKAQTPQARPAEIQFFGKTMPAWRVWDEVHTHTVWTAGQIVANFRKHGMAPPAFTFF